MDIQELEGKRIAVLLSGGVDSSVVVYEFARLGLHPDCFYIKIGPEEKEDWDCNSEEDLEMATLVHVALAVSWRSSTVIRSIGTR